MQDKKLQYRGYFIVNLLTSVENKHIITFLSKFHKEFFYLMKYEDDNSYKSFPILEVSWWDDRKLLFLIQENYLGSTVCSLQ